MRFWTLLPPTVLFLALSGPVLGDVHPAGDQVESVPGDPALEGMLLPWSFFSAMAKEEGTMAIDVRADFLGGPTPPGMETARPIPLEVFRANFVARKANQDKTLLIFDETGQTYLELHRFLEENGYRDYYFLSGGAEATLRLLERGS